MFRPLLRCRSFWHEHEDALARDVAAHYEASDSGLLHCGAYKVCPEHPARTTCNNRKCKKANRARWRVWHCDPAVTRYMMFSSACGFPYKLVTSG